MFNTAPLVSVIMPAYNADKTIGRAIESVLNQTYSNIDLIIVNDGSTDKTSEVVRQYYDTRIVLINQPNKGLSGARNSGLEKVKGDYVAFIDSDDWYENDYVERLVSSISTTHSQLVVCGMVAHKNNNTSCSASFDSTYDSCFRNAEFLSRFESGIMNSVCNKLYQTTILQAYRLKFKIIAIVEDLEFNLRYLDCIERVCFIPECLYHYDNNHSVLTTKVSAEMFANYIHIHAWLFSKIPIAYFPIVSSFLYHQYVALSLRYINLYILKKRSEKEVQGVLDYYLSNSLIQDSLKNYRSKCAGERILTNLLRYKQIRLLGMYLRILNHGKNNET